MTARPAATPTWGGTQTEPSGGQKSAGFAPGDRPPAEWFNWLLDHFSDWINYLDTEKLRDVIQVAADIGLFGTTSKPNEHPTSASNRWKEIISAPTNLSTTTRVRLLVGDGDADGTWAITFNARWNCASGDQNWQADNTSADSSLLIASPNGLMQIQTRAAGAGTWTSWTNSNLNVATLAASVDVNVGGDLTVTGGGTIGSDLDVTGDVAATGDVHAGGDFEYTSPPTRTVVIPMQLGTPKGVGAALQLADDSTWELPGNSGVIFPIEIPRGATLATIRTLFSTDGGGAVDWVLDLRQRTGFAFTGSASVGTDSSIASNSGTLGSGLNFQVLTGLATAIAANTVYYLSVGAAVGSVGKMWLTGLQLVFSDPGPRNF